MKTRALKNYSSSVGCEVYDIDFNSEEEIIELGKIVAHNCVVYVDQKIPTEQLYKTMSHWGDDSRALIQSYVLSKKLTGRHWREVLLNLGFLNRGLGDLAGAVTRVSYERDERGNPTGLFPQGELDWHSDQFSRDDAQRIIGLQSVSGSANSQTQFLCTHDAYESLSSDMRSMIKELVVKHKWHVAEDGSWAVWPGMSRQQEMALKYNAMPIDGMETRLYGETVTGLSGVKLLHHSFDGFVGMGREESDKILEEIKNAVFQDKYVYTQDWEDGQIVFMDQQITLHKRPTNLSHGNKRVMSRVITYLNKIYPESQPTTHVGYKGQLLTHDEFAKLVDEDRLKTFLQEEEARELELNH
ncbi:TauD Probable taurine catabolism dioxygenase [uncultured Caudovirales phage]|uniref:TauD Probable taurine catabolism dioxygenase n=1 Tax=uncultured Caudovirales phage TaxID=2100421 RepID=A0A6J5LK90_9CAUD|nr:TauD Probable taurine catabolism dioxygenase [uncultured Caudovirales phage]